MTEELHFLLNGSDQGRFEDFGAETAVVATTADDQDDDVYVTLPNSASPNTRLEVTWRPGVQFVDGVPEPLYPSRGDKGIVIETDTGERWLIW